MQKKQLIIIISGTPGTGKTTIALLLKEKFSAEYLNLTEVAIANDFILETDEQRDTKVADTEKLIPFLEKFISEHSTNIIIEGHYADIVPDPLISVFIILRTDPHVLEQRLIEKQFPPQKIQENLQSEILSVCVSNALETHEKSKIYEVDTSTASIQETLGSIHILIETRPPSNLGQINWMQKLDGKKLMEHFP